MKRSGFDRFEKSIVSSGWTTAAEVKVSENVDKIVIAVYNGYTGSAAPSLSVRILGQFIPGGEFAEVKMLRVNFDGGVWPSTIENETVLWGALDDFGFEAVRVQCKRTGSEAVPVIVEFKFLSNEVGE